MNELAVEAVGSLQALAAQSGVRLRAEGEPCAVDGDPQRLHQTLTNLIENAIKFTPPGGEVVVSSWRADSEVGVTVADTGGGIPAEARAHVFDRFYRADPSRSRESGGSGLGLAICYEIMAAHGGRIWVRSEQGHGSAFSIALPLRPAIAPAAPPEAPPPESPPPAAPPPERQPSAVSRSAAG